MLVLSASLDCDTSEELDNDEGDCGAEEIGEIGVAGEEEELGDGGASGLVVTLIRLLGLLAPEVWSSTVVQGSDISINPHQPEKKKVSKYKLDIQ
jgi:hypothetical protein